MTYPQTKLPREYPMDAITLPTFNQNIGSSYFGILRLLFDAPITEVRRACLEALRKDNIGSSGYKHFQGEEERSRPAHEMVQCGIVAVAAEDLEASMTIVRYYLRDTRSAYQIDGQYHHGHEILDSRVMFSKVLKFVARIFLVRKPKFFRWGKLDSNPLYLEPKLLEQLLDFIGEKQGLSGWSKETNLILRAVASKLWSELASDDTMDSERWELYELLFRYACQSWDKGHFKRYPVSAQRSMMLIARRMVSGEIRFASDYEFGNLLKERVATVCYHFLWRFYEQSTEAWLKEEYDLCKANLAEVDGGTALAEYDNLVSILRYVPDWAKVPDLKRRHQELSRHITSHINYVCPVSQGGPC